MRYIPNLTKDEIDKNHQLFAQRVAIYQKIGMDFLKSRSFILEKSEPLNGSILEIGTGTGHTAITLARAGYELSSVDKDEEVLKKAALNLAYENLLSKVELYVMDGRSLSFGKGSFDNIIAVNMFHHVNGLDQILAEMDRVTAQKGKIIISDFNKKGMDIIGHVHKKEGNDHEDSGVTKEELEKRFKKLGFVTDRYKGDTQWIIIAKKVLK